MALHRRKAVALVLALAPLVAVAWVGTGCSTTSASPTNPPPIAGPPTATGPPPGAPPGTSGTAATDPTNPGYDPNAAAQGHDPNAAATAPQPAPVAIGPTVGQRALGALNGMLMGAVIGGQAGPFGLAAGAAVGLIYSAITGTVPLSGGRSYGGYPGGYGGGGYGGYGYPTTQDQDRERSIDEQIQSEEKRQASLESEIDQELKRQEELLKTIDQQDAPKSARVEPGPGPAPSDAEIREQSDPRVAPSVPKERELPASVYQEQKMTVAPGKWGNDKPLEVKRRSLDADRDGKPEEIVYLDARTGQILRKENDLNFDGTIDAWSTYENGVCVARELDADFDGKVDTWETYAAGRMVTREVDRNDDGVRDAFFRYEGDSLVEEKHDSNNDGKIDLVITYANRHRIRSEEDSDKDGRMDTWTTFASGDGNNDRITRIEKDPKGTGKPTLVETYVQENGKTVISTREEDVNGDGKVDVKSTYENGKLKNREISDPSLVPL